MFKRFIEKVIAELKAITKRLEDAYEMTYPDYELLNNFNKEVKKRKRKNKEKLIERMTMAIGRKCYEDTGEIMNYKAAKLIALEMFSIGKSKGDIDELNELKDTED